MNLQAIHLQNSDGMCVLDQANWGTWKKQTDKQTANNILSCFDSMVLEFISGSFQYNLTPDHEDICHKHFQHSISLQSFHVVTSTSVKRVVQIWCFLGANMCTLLCYTCGWAGSSQACYQRTFSFVQKRLMALCCIYHLDFMKRSPYVRTACMRVLTLFVCAFLLLFRAGMQRLAEFLMKL